MVNRGRHYTLGVKNGGLCSSSNLGIATTGAGLDRLKVSSVRIHMNVGLICLFLLHLDIDR